jgi:CubicO group peptidase (beta-lactamase class C family)
MRSLDGRDRCLLLVIVAWLGLIISAATRGDNTPAPVVSDSLATRWSSALNELHVPGLVVVAVNRDGIVRRDLLGDRDVERKLPLDLDSRIYIASCTKTFVACAVVLLANDGTLDLDAPVKRYLPRFTLADAGYADSITVRDLLCHRPGLVNKTITFGEAYTGQMTDERFYRLLAGTKPRRSFAYSNLHYTLLGRVIEAATGRSWKDVLDDRVFKPAGMTRTTCSASAAWHDKNMALPYDWASGAYIDATPHKVNETMHAAGGIYTTGRDLARWMRLQLGNGVIDGKRVFTAGALRTMRELLDTDAAEGHPLIKSEKRLAWGGGWDIRTLHADTLYCHNGNYAGTGAFISCIPSRNLGVAVIANGSGASVMLCELVAAETYDALLGAKHDDYLPTLFKMAASRSKQDAAPATSGKLTLAPQRYAGEFQSADWGKLTLSAKNQALDARIGALPLPLKLTGIDRFIAGDYSGRFELDAKGKVAAVWLWIAPPDSVCFERLR